MNIKSTPRKLILCLSEQVNAITNEIETRNHSSFCKIVSEITDVEICESSFARTLCMPNHAAFFASFKSFFDGFGVCDKELWVTHDVLFKFDFTCILVRMADISDAET